MAAGCARDSVPAAWTPSFPPTTDLPTASASPTPTPTPPASPTPTPAPASGWVNIQATVPPASPELYQQAMDVYRQYYASVSTAELAGGMYPLPPEMADLLTGDALKKISAIQKAAKEHGFHWEGSPYFYTVNSAQLTTDVPGGTVIALQACEVTGGARLLTSDGTLLLDGSDVMVVHHYFMKYNNQHQLIVWDITGGTEAVETCPF